MKDKSKNYLLPFTISLTLAIGLWMGHILSPNSKGFDLNSGEEKYAKFKDIIEVLNTRYVDTLNSDKIFEDAIADMLHKLDPHSNYIPASELKAINEQIDGKFGGVGVRFSIIRDTICVTNVIFGSPSYQVGVQAGDKFISIDGKNVAKKKITNEKVMSLLKGEENTPVKVQIYRNKKKITKQIIRGTIPLESIVCTTMLTKDVGYIKLDQFSIASYHEFSRSAATLKAKGMKKLIFDLRNNPGGVLQTAVEIVDEFLAGNKEIVKTKGSHIKEEKYLSTSKGILENTELVILINSNSASASEIVAGALQDNDRATIMGRRSFGKGLVQQDIALKDGSNLRLTIARYYTPTGRCIQKPYMKDYEEYYSDQLERYENGELYKIDSSLLVDSLKFKTPKGKVVYGGGGILPDVFIPLDTVGSSWYFTELRYSPVFQNFAFDFLQNKRTKWKSITDFNTNFKIDETILESFVKYAEKNFKIYRNISDLKVSKNLITQTIKAEIARQLWTEQGYYTVVSSHDKEVLRALQFLSKK